MHEELMRLYGRAMGVIEPLRIRLWSEAELTTTQLRVLFFVRERPGATLRDIAEQLSVTPPSASGLVDRLVRQEYLQRAGDPNDRRYVHHELTQRGAAVVTELEREGRMLLDSILGRLSDDELRRLTEALTAFVEAAGAEALQAAPK
jgi:DNA-binding MarR family transcriptional regulator